MSLRAALVGCGRWGTKLLGALQRSPALRVICVADPDPAARARAAAVVADARLVESVAAALSEKPDVVLLATPSVLHAVHALEVLEAGIDCFVEKPLALSGSDARQLCRQARRSSRVGMVGHVLRYHPAVERLVALVDEGVIGAVQRVRGRRWTQSGSADPLWTLGPHELSTLHALDGSAAERLVAVVDEPTPVRLELVLGSGLEARFELSTTAARPERWLSVEGRRGRLVIDELDPSRMLVWTDSAGGASPKVLSVPEREPLLAELDELARCVARRRSPRTSFEEAAWVVEQLERAQEAGRAAARRAAPAIDRRRASP